MAKPNLYETLGIKPDASPAEIKRARRKRAEKLHPDKGGSHEDMSAVNHAFDVLIDPERRLLYDSTGEEAKAPKEQRVSGLLMRAFMDAITSDSRSILSHARKFINLETIKLQQSKQEGQRSVSELKRKRERITTKNPVNLFHAMIDQNITFCQQKLAAIDNEIEDWQASLKELENYNSADSISLTDLMAAYGTISGINSER